MTVVTALPKIWGGSSHGGFLYLLLRHFSVEVNLGDGFIPDQNTDHRETGSSVHYIYYFVICALLGFTLFTEKATGNNLHSSQCFLLDAHFL